MKSVLEEARSAIWKFQEDIVVKFENNGLGFYLFLFSFSFILYCGLRMMKTKCDTVTGHMTGHMLT